MKTVYKLTDKNSQTYNKTQWGENVTHTTSGKGNLCSDGWLHSYEHPLLAMIFNPVHGNYQGPLLWLAEASGRFKYDYECKLGSTSLTTKKQIPLPELSLEFLNTFAIRCALHVYKCPNFLQWATAWLTGKDRSESAESAAWSARSAESAAKSARSAAWSARSAESAAWSVRSVGSVRSAESAECAAWSAAKSAEYAAWSARSAAKSARSAESAARATKKNPKFILEIALKTARELNVLFTE